MKKLEGLDIVYFEARHSKALGDLIALQGGRAFAAPAMKEVPIEDNVQALEFAERWFAGKVDVLILLTGVGTKTLMSVLEPKYGRQRVLEAMKKTILIPRGPKPIRVLNEWGVPFAFTVPEPNTWKELLSSIDAWSKEKGLPLAGKSMAVQEYGVTNPELIEGLEKRGAQVLRVPVYRWALPDDTRPLESEILQMVSGNRHVAVFTTAVQSEHLFQVARKMGLEPRLKQAFSKIVVASVGPDCTEALKSHGLRVDIQPESPKMGPLVVATAEKAREVLKKLDRGEL